MAGLANTIEAILYLKAKPLSIGEIAEYASCDRDAAEEGLIELMGDYAHREGALEIAETEEGYSLQLKQPFRPLLDQLIPLDIGVGALRTLAAIALRGPITQPDLVELRGSGVYQHVPDLVDQGFVRKRRQSDGRSFWLQVTEKFYQRFEIDKLPEISVPKSFAGRNAEPGDDDPGDDQTETNETQTSEAPTSEAELKEPQKNETSLEGPISETADSEPNEATHAEDDKPSQEPDKADLAPQPVDESAPTSDTANSSVIDENLNKAETSEKINQEEAQEKTSPANENHPPGTTRPTQESPSEPVTVKPDSLQNSAPNDPDQDQLLSNENAIPPSENT